MNTKKNKNKNKPKPNPSPAKTEEVLPKTEVTPDVKEDINKSDERVPEIVSDIVTPKEVKCSQEDLPKKPKRNRGKKKKGEVDSEFEQPVTETVIGGSEPTDISAKTAAETVKEVEKEEVTPATRKNKNKGNKDDNQSDKSEVKPIPPSPVSSKSDITESQIKPATPEIPVEESKTSKKKNKKKKRNDSEKSDKVEEISCTSAFLKILEPREDNSDTKTTKSESKQTEAVSVPVKDTEVIIEAEAISKQENIITQPEPPKDEGGKGKKKNNKDKKHQVKAGTEDQISIPTDEQILEVAILMPLKEEVINVHQPTIPELPKDICFTESSKAEEIATTLPMIAKENSPKPKAKIAKPVDKKKIDIVEDSPIKSESVSTGEAIPTEKVCLDMILKETKRITIPIQPVEALKQEIIALPGVEGFPEPITVSTATHNIQPENSKTDSKVEDKQTEQIMVPQNGACKKRKKSPKPKRDFMPFETSSMTEIQIRPNIGINPESDIIVAVETTEPKPPTQGIMPDTEEQIMTAIPLVFESKPESAEVKKDLPKSPSERDVAKPAEQIPLPSGGMSKRGKKSPKLPKKLDIKIAEESSEDLNKPSEQGFLRKDDKQSIETPFDLPVLEEIEIKSVKNESDGSLCDIAPEVQHPRASSQIKDNNNNQTVIQEVRTEEPLSVPTMIQDTPFVQDSGETPTTSPEIISGGVQITEIKSKKSDEKTDIKSKMMEVNKDMEDLRKSIERSLAEFTALEKTEQEVEQKFEEQHLKKEAKKSEDEVKNINIKPKEKQTTIQETILPKTEIPLEEQQTAYISKTMETEPTIDTSSPPVIPSRKDNKGKNKSKKGKGKHGSEQTTSSSTVSESGANVSTSGNDNKSTPESKTEAKYEQKSETEKKGKQQADNNQSKSTDSESKSENNSKANFEPIESFEDALTSSTDDVNKSFEIIANDESNIKPFQDIQSNNPKDSVTEPDEEKIDRQEKNNPVTQPKNLLGYPNIPARLNKTDYKKEKNKPPNTRQARVKIKDSNPVEVQKESKQSQTDSKRFLKQEKANNEAVTCMTNENEEYVYKYSFRKVFLPSACQVCKKDLSQTRVACGFCNLIFYCSPKHKDEDYPQHQALCFALSTVVHLKDQKHIYADCQNITGQDYRLLRMQNIISCEKILKRNLAAWEQEVLLYPRICADVACREWRQGQLKDCDGCGQISYCKDKDHLPKTHQRWCKSYLLYKKLVTYQQTIGRLEPKLPSRVMSEHYQIPDKFNEVLASLYEEKIDMNDIQYATLTQIATAPLTAAYCYQLYSNKMNASFANGNVKKSTFTIHVVNAELQFEADALNKWEVFFLHLRPDLTEVKVVLIGRDLNPSNLPLELLGNIRMCNHCRQNQRRVYFEFQDKKSYTEYFASNFTVPDLVCTFNPSIQRSSVYNGKDVWPSTIKCIAKLKAPIIVTSYTIKELVKDVGRVKEIADNNINVVLEPKLNTFASVRPDRNFITDDEIPLLFKNYFVSVVCGGF